MADDIATERIFGALDTPPVDPRDPEDYAQKIRKLIDDADDYENSDLAPNREENTEYYYGMRPTLPPLDDEAAQTYDENASYQDQDVGRSTIVSTDVRDTVMAVMPSLVRAFAGSEKPVYCVPNYEAQSDAAEQCTDYLSYIVWEDNDGFLMLHSVFKDALTVKTGIVKWWTKENTETKEMVYRGITQEQLRLIIMEAEGFADLEVLNVESDPKTPEIIKEARVRVTISKPHICVEAVPPEEFRISRYARTVAKSQLVGHERVVEVSELVEMGYDEDFIRSFSGTSLTFSVERTLRNPGMDTDVRIEDSVSYGEYYIRVDKDGDGIAELRHICVIGDEHQIIDDYMCDYPKFAVFCPDPRSHTVIGDSLADLTKDIQKLKTNMLRSTLDSLAQSIFSRTVVNETLTSVEDALNQEVGAVIRTRGNVNDAVAQLVTPFVGKDVFPMIQYTDQLRQSRTGISEASKGMDPRALQSTNVMGVDAIVTGAQERIELIARILAETGFKDLYKGLLREVVANPDYIRTVQLRGKWTKIDPSVFDPNMKISVNPTIGKGSDMMRFMALQEVKAMQLMVMEKYGLANPFVTPQEFRNTLVDLLSIANIKNVGRYFKELSPEVLKSIMEAPKEPDPALLLAQAELEKVRSKTVQTIAQLNQDMEKFFRSDDFNRDKLNVESLLKAAEIVGKFATEIVRQPVIEGMNQPLTPPISGLIPMQVPKLNAPPPPGPLAAPTGLPNA